MPGHFYRQLGLRCRQLDIAERSEERSGIAFVYALKSLLLLMPALLFLQGLAGALRLILTLVNVPTDRRESRGNNG